MNDQLTGENRSVPERPPDRRRFSGCLDDGTNLAFDISAADVPEADPAVDVGVESDDLDEFFDEAAMWAYQYVGALTTVYDFADDDIIPLLDHLDAMTDGRADYSWPAVPGSVRRRIERDKSKVVAEPAGGEKR